MLTFSPRCLVAENGWLCCGSEYGDFVAINMEDIDGGLPSGVHLENEVRRQMASDLSREEAPLLSLMATSRRTNKSVVAKSTQLAKERINCVTLWFPPSVTDSFAGAYSEAIAVLANNDKTVVLVSLRDFRFDENVRPLETIEYPDFVNRAIISPDGRMLVGILDDPYLYVHQRVKAEAGSGTSSPSDGFRWEQKQRILLKSQKKDDKSDSRGSFAACFSSSGAYLAVGTQHGTISVFDATLLLDPVAEPLITTFQSTRPHCGPGAVRDMAFCPGPFDILAWTEDRARVGFADVRSNFIVRQIVDISSVDKFEHVETIDRATIDPRLLGSATERRSEPSALRGAGHTGALVEALETLNQPLNANDTAVLEAIQGDRRRRDRLTQRDPEARSRVGPSDLTWTYLSSLRPPSTEGGSQRARQRSSSIGYGATGDYLGSYREQRSRHEVMLARQRREAAANPQTPGARRPDQRWMDRIGETITAMRDQRERQDSSYLNVLEILQARERPSNEGSGDDSSFLVPLVNQVINRWDESAIRGTINTDYGVFEVPPSPDNTAGLSWSQDGRIL